MQRLVDYISEELNAIESKANKGKLTMQELQLADMLAHTKKNLLKCAEIDGGAYSERGTAYRKDGDAMTMMTYADDMHATNARRDPSGRYSGAGCYSMDNSSMIDELRSMMDKAPDELKRQEFKRFIDKLQRM